MSGYTENRKLDMILENTKNIIQKVDNIKNGNVKVHVVFRQSWKSTTSGLGVKIILDVVSLDRTFAENRVVEIDAAGGDAFVFTTNFNQFTEIIVYEGDVR